MQIHFLFIFEYVEWVFRVFRAFIFDVGWLRSDHFRLFSDWFARFSHLFSPFFRVAAPRKKHPFRVARREKGAPHGARGRAARLGAQGERRSEPARAMPQSRGASGTQAVDCGAAS